jgi:hypothetical protein
MAARIILPEGRLRLVVGLTFVSAMVIARLAGNEVSPGQKVLEHSQGASHWRQINAGIGKVNCQRQDSSSRSAISCGSTSIFATLPSSPDCVAPKSSPAAQRPAPLPASTARPRCDTGPTTVCSPGGSRKLLRERCLGMDFGTAPRSPLDLANEWGQTNRQAAGLIRLPPFVCHSPLRQTFLRKYSMVWTRPCARATFGSQRRIFRARVISGRRCLGSS